jgi:glycosyltransferase involved in cell wall biosynthesis
MISIIIPTLNEERIWFIGFDEIWFKLKVVK